MTFSSNGFCWAGSINARQKHKFPNGIIKLKLENYNSFLKYKLFPGLKNFLKEKEHNFKILNLYLKKLSTYLITVYIKGKGLHRWSQFSQQNVSKCKWHYLPDGGIPIRCTSMKNHKMQPIFASLAHCRV